MKSVLLAVALLGVAHARARADDVTYQLEASVASTFVDRGIPQYLDRRDPVMQDSVAAQVPCGPGQFVLGGTSAVALSDYAKQDGNAVELDFEGAYEYPMGDLTLAAGYAIALLPKHEAGAHLDDTHEISIAASLHTSYVTPAVELSVDPIRQHGGYLAVGASREFHAGSWTVTPLVSVGAAAYRNYGGADMAVGPHLNDVSTSLGMQCDLGGGTYVAAHFSYAYRGTPAWVMDTGTTFQDRSSVVAGLAFGVTR